MIETFLIVTCSYSIDRNTDEKRQFKVDANGLVTVAGKLDRETTAVHRVHILALDKGEDVPRDLAENRIVC